MNDVSEYKKLKSEGLLPSPKGVMLSLMRLCEREDVQLHELAQLIQGDPVLAGRVIKIANSAKAYPSRPVASVTADVLILVGIQAIRQLVLSMSLVGANRSGGCQGFDYAGFWQRSFCMGCAAQAIAMHIRVAPPAEMFTCGLLAQVGRLGLASAYPAAYGPLVRDGLSVVDGALRESEREAFGFDHLDLAAWMMEDWRIPALFVEAMLHHESPHLSPLAPSSRQQRIVNVLYLALTIAEDVVAGNEREITMVPAVLKTASVLEISIADLQVAVERTIADWHDWRNVLEL